MRFRRGSASWTAAVAEVRPLVEVQNELEDEDICERLRAAGIKCAVEPLHIRAD